ncbi:hypothetical protein QBC36DRAFT_368494 [Triangularia setosa]|uniref:Uncharacterized protein n=1 Tax=Triangularia setosa TaxID=2587417 RepID=A0AAN6VWE9_9PEZI|nr:hypothetical protein QBC36DRAFT_368494 [Podospora setosa]
MIDHTLTAPASGPTPFEFTTSTQLDIWGDYLPSEFLADYLLPKATALPVETCTQTSYFERTDIVRQIHVKPTDLPPTRHGGPPIYGDASYYRWKLDKLNQPYLSHCCHPDDSLPLSRPEPCPYTYNGKCSKLKPWMVIVAAVIPSILLLVQAAITYCGVSICGSQLNQVGMIKALLILLSCLPKKPRRRPLER